MTEGTQLGPLLAQGRDADVFAFREGLVARRFRDGRPMATELQVLEYLESHDYPVPHVHDVLDDGRVLVMDRIEGPTMLEAVGKAPWRMRSLARALARLHQQLHVLDAPPFVRPSPVGPGDRLVHLDLHPLNVLVAARGPVVIDWTNASAGNPDDDVAIAWAILHAAELPERGAKATLLGLGRKAFLSAFLSGFDRERVGGRLGDAIAWKTADAHLSAAEVAAMRSLASRGR